MQLASLGPVLQPIARGSSTVVLPEKAESNTWVKKPLIVVERGGVLLQPLKTAYLF